MKDMFENPVFRRYDELQQSGALTWEFVRDEYLPEILQLLAAGELRLDSVTHEGMRFVPVDNETEQ